MILEISFETKIASILRTLINQRKIVKINLTEVVEYLYVNMAVQVGINYGFVESVSWEEVIWQNQF